MKTPEEIKKGLECCYTELEDPYFACKGCPYGSMRVCDGKMGRDALAYILQLEQENAALREALKTADDNCEYCKYALRPSAPCEAVDFDCEACESKCRRYTCEDGSN